MDLNCFHNALCRRWPLCCRPFLVSAEPLPAAKSAAPDICKRCVKFELAMASPVTLSVPHGALHVLQFCSRCKSVKLKAKTADGALFTLNVSHYLRVSLPLSLLDPGRWPHTITSQPCCTERTSHVLHIRVLDHCWCLHLIITLSEQKVANGSASHLMKLEATCMRFCIVCLKVRLRKPLEA